jgi:hypothetical protein
MSFRNEELSGCVKHPENVRTTNIGRGSDKPVRVVVTLFCAYCIQAFDQSVTDCNTSLSSPAICRNTGG